MFFEADLRGKHYKVDITETRRAWKINLQEDGHEWVHYDISKDDYKLVENAIIVVYGLHLDQAVDGAIVR